MNGIIIRRVGPTVLAALLCALALTPPAQAQQRKPAAKATASAKKTKAKSPKPNAMARKGKAASPKAAGEAQTVKPAAPAVKSEPESKAEALPPLDLNQLIETGLAENKGLQARRSLIAAEEAKVPQARALPDPMIGAMADGFFAMGGDFEIKARQMIMGKGKRRLMGEAAEVSVQRTVADYREQARQVVTEVKQAYYDLYFLDKSVDIAMHNKALLADFVKLAEVKYGVGQGLQQDVLRAQVAQSRVLDDLIMLRQQRTSAQARLNALLNRPPQSPLGPAATLERNKVTLSEESLQAMALEQRPMLKGMQLMVAESEKMTDLARRELKPNYEVELGVRPGGQMGGTGETDVSLEVMLQVPLYHRQKQDKAIEQRVAETEAARSDYEAQKTMVFSMIRDDLAMLEMSDRQIELYRNGIIPQAELSLESARAGYQVGKVDFLSLLDSQISLYNDLRTYYRALTDYEKAVAGLEQTVGASLDTGTGSASRAVREGVPVPEPEKEVTK